MRSIDPNTLNAMVRRLREVPRSSRTARGADRRAPEQGFWAEVTAEDDGAYSWKRMQPNGAGDLTDDASAATGTLNAFEVNGATGIASGTRVWLRFAGYISNTPIFLFSVASSLPPGAGQYKVLQLDMGGTPHWDYARAHN